MKLNYSSNNSGGNWFYVSGNDVAELLFGAERGRGALPVRRLARDQTMGNRMNEYRVWWGREGDEDLQKLKDHVVHKTYAYLKRRREQVTESRTCPCGAEGAIYRLNSRRRCGQCVSALLKMNEGAYRKDLIAKMTCVTCGSDTVWSGLAGKAICANDAEHETIDLPKPKPDLYRFVSEHPAAKERDEFLRPFFKRTW